MVRVLALGNEFIKGDSLAKEVGDFLKKDFEVVKIKDSFELMEILKDKEDFVVLDVVQNLKEVREIGLDDLRVNSVLSAHDFDAGFVLKLFGDKIKIVGIPMEGDVFEIENKVNEMIRNF
jgi:Ni,Fe-hydrogenase maturation factor